MDTYTLTPSTLDRNVRDRSRLPARLGNGEQDIVISDHHGSNQPVITGELDTRHTVSADALRVHLGSVQSQHLGRSRLVQSGSDQQDVAHLRVVDTGGEHTVHLRGNWLERDALRQTLTVEPSNLTVGERRPHTGAFRDVLAALTEAERLGVQLPHHQLLGIGQLPVTTDRGHLMADLGTTGVLLSREHF